MFMLWENSVTCLCHGGSVTCLCHGRTVLYVYVIGEQCYMSMSCENSVTYLCHWRTVLCVYVIQLCVVNSMIHDM